MLDKLSRPSLFKDKCLIGGKWVEASSGKRFQVTGLCDNLIIKYNSDHFTDPGTGKDWASAPDSEVIDVNCAVHAAHEAFAIYSRFSPRIRSQLLLKWSTLIKENKEDLAKIITYETGKPLAESLFELDYAINSSYWFAGEADRIQGTVFDSSTPGKKVLTIKQPIGVVVALVPWNFPVS
jgi:succinate-semialdehyde dehydrogenase / glutarate-semialdehyde dehydrogenase